MVGPPGSGFAARLGLVPCRNVNERRETEKRELLRRRTHLSVCVAAVLFPSPYSYVSMDTLSDVEITVEHLKVPRVLA